MENKQEVNPNVKASPNNLSGEDVIKTGTGVGKDVLKQTAVWVLAGFLTEAVRKMINKK